MFKKLILATALVAASASAFAAGVTYKLDPSHTMVLASWNHFGFSNPTANFGQVDGTLVYDAKDVSKYKVDVTLNKAGEHPMKKVPTIGFDATTTIKRSEFGVGAYVPNVSDAITLRITTEASAAKQ